MYLNIILNFFILLIQIANCLNCKGKRQKKELKKIFVTQIFPSNHTGYTFCAGYTYCAHCNSYQYSSYTIFALFAHFAVILRYLTTSIFPLSSLFFYICPFFSSLSLYFSPSDQERERTYLPFYTTLLW